MRIKLDLLWVVSKVINHKAQHILYRHHLLRGRSIDRIKSNQMACKTHNLLSLNWEMFREIILSSEKIQEIPEVLVRMLN